MPHLRTPTLFAAVLGLALVGVAATSGRQVLAAGTQIRTFVATTGSDSNPCSRIAPCRTFAAALAQTASGGEIVALDSGGYGSVTITQAVTIVAAPGIQASIAPTTGAAITVIAGASDVVVLRNLYLNAQGANYGVRYLTGAALHIEQLVINGFTSIGIAMTKFTADPSELYVADTVVRNGSSHGIYLYSDSVITNVSIVRARVEDPDVVVAAERITAVGREGDARAVVRPGRLAVIECAPRQLVLLRAVRRDGPDVVAAVTVGKEGDPFAIRRPDRLPRVVEDVGDTCRGTAGSRQCPDASLQIDGERAAIG